MSLDKLAVELDETARQTAEMIYKINEGLAVLMDQSIPCAKAREVATSMMVVALQAQDRIQQRSDNIVQAARLMGRIVDEIAGQLENEDVWDGLSLDELRKPDLHGVAVRARQDDIELF